MTVDSKTATFVADGKPFYFIGTNAYYLMQEKAYGSTDTIDALDAAKAVGMTVVRTWGFADGTSWTNASDPAVLQASPGVYHESAFAAMDFVISEAQKRGIRLIISLVNNWPDFGGMINTSSGPGWRTTMSSMQTRPRNNISKTTSKTF